MSELTTESTYAEIVRATHWGSGAEDNRAQALITAKLATTIAKAGESADRLGNKVFALNFVIALATVVAAVFPVVLFLCTRKP